MSGTARAPRPSRRTEPGLPPRGPGSVLSAADPGEHNDSPWLPYVLRMANDRSARAPTGRIYTGHSVAHPRPRRRLSSRRRDPGHVTMPVNPLTSNRACEAGRYSHRAAYVKGRYRIVLIWRGAVLAISEPDTTPIRDEHPTFNQT